MTLLRELKESGRIIKIQTKEPWKSKKGNEFSEDEAKELGLFEWSEPKDVDDTILNQRINWNQDSADIYGDGEYILSPFPHSYGDEENIILLEKAGYYTKKDAEFVITIFTPTEVMLRERIKDQERELVEIKTLQLIVIESGQNGKQISKRTETGINKFSTANGFGEICSYSNYNYKRLNLRLQDHKSFRCEIDIRGNNTEEEWASIHRWFIDRIESREESIKNLEHEITRLDVYKDLSDKMRTLRREVEKEVDSASSIIRRRFPLLFGFQTSLVGE